MHPSSRRAVSGLVLALALALASGGAPPLAAQAKHPFAVEDLVVMDRVSDPRPSPDGRSIVYTLRSTDLAANKGRFDLWSVGSDGSGARRLTNDPANDTDARWAPDGRSIYFLSTRSGSSQVWRLPLDGGEPTRVTDLPLDVGSLTLSPDGKTFAFAIEVFVDCPTLACTAERLKASEESKVSARVYEKLFIRHWDTWEDGRRSHLFTLPVAGGEPVDLMKGMDADAPSQPFGGADEWAFTPDGKSIVFTAKDVGREEAWSTNFDLFVVPLDGSAAPRDLTAALPGTETSPVFSPDGRTMAYRAQRRAGFEADRFDIHLRSGLDGADRVIAAAWDRSPNELVWSADGKTLYATAESIGQQPLFAIDVASGRATELVSQGSAHSPALLSDGRIVFGWDHLASPVDLYAVRPGEGAMSRLTAANAERMATIAFGELQQMSFRGAGGDTVWAWVVKPVGFDPAQRYPVAFLIHGGPQGSFGNNFHYRWNAQAYAGRGYAAVMVDFHGSTGYGQAFTDAITGDWGGKPFEDLKRGLEAVLAANPWMDGNRVAALGASYGAYMVNWIAGQWPDRFRCLVTHDGNLDERAAYFSTEELWFDEWEHHGTPWDNPQGFEKWSPVQGVKNWKTPMLVIHGGKDYRVVDTGGIGVFTAAQRRGIPSKFVYFPDENHWVLKPQNSIFWHHTVLDWLDQWTKGAAAN
jgi:dipeptidyl aminopeptidase/acylaminoacyl peptidase